MPHPTKEQLQHRIKAANVIAKNKNKVLDKLADKDGNRDALCILIDYAVKHGYRGALYQGNYSRLSAFFPHEDVINWYGWNTPAICPFDPAIHIEIDDAGNYEVHRLSDLNDLNKGVYSDRHYLKTARPEKSFTMRKLAQFIIADTHRVAREMGIEL